MIQQRPCAQERLPSATVQHTSSDKGHGRRESRSIKTLAIADNLGGIAFPHAKLALRVHRRRKATGGKETRQTVYAVTSLDAHQATPAELASHMRGHWTVEAQHHIRDRTFAEDASIVHAGSAPRAMAALPNLAIGALKPSERQTSPRTPAPSATNRSEPTPSWASPPSSTSTELDQILIVRRAGPPAVTSRT